MRWTRGAEVYRLRHRVVKECAPNKGSSIKTNDSFAPA